MWWDHDLLISIKAYESKAPRAGRAACDRLLSRPGLPAEIEECTRRNATWYADVFPSEELWSLPGYFNPSIASDPNGNLQMILRQANYTLSPGGLYYTFPPEDDGVIKTVNHLASVTIAGRGVEVDPNLQPLNDDAVVHRPSPFPVEGIEDCRLFWCGGSWRVSGTVRDRDENGICTQMLAQLEGEALVDPYQLSSGHSHEKNWMPVPEQGAFVDRCYPLMLRAMKPRLIIKAVDAPYIARSFRGGAQVLWWPERARYVGLVHESINFLADSDPDHWRCYTHRFLGWDHDWRLREISYPFTLAEKRSIEFGAGMVRVDDDLLVSFGQRDASAHLIRMKLSDVASALENHSPVT